MFSTINTLRVRNRFPDWKFMQCNLRTARYEANTCVRSDNCFAAGLPDVLQRKGPNIFTNWSKLGPNLKFF